VSAIRTAVVEDLGCKVNHAEAEALARRLGGRGLRVVPAHGEAADLVVINSCTVTAVADQKSRQALRRARREHPNAEIVVTGCSVAVDPAPFAMADPAARLIDARTTGALDAELDAILAAAGPSPTVWGVDVVGDRPPERERTRAYIKVQDGCSFHCTYCVIPRARGPERSLSAEAVLEDIRAALARGRREIVLTGINIGTYDGGASEPGPRGSHAWEALSLSGLIRRILEETPVERLRLSSIEAQHVTDELLSVWASSGGRCVPHFHVPLQSGDDGVLRRMGRRYDTAFYADLIRRIRRIVPDAAIHGDVIVGFPTEDEAAWKRGRAFIESVGFAGLHVFRYSPRPGTPATRMTGQVDERTRQARAADLLAFAAARRRAFARAQVGRVLTVLFEEPVEGGRPGWVGHAENHVLVEAEAADGEPLANEIGHVRVVETLGDGSRVRGTLEARDGK
jgi:threonylcarbamoyladenosine tRNA methylthiotransferase MtaB